MAATNHTLLGSVQAIQYDGTNLADIEAVLTAKWNIYTSTTDTIVTFCQNGYENLQLGGFLAHPTDWLVSMPAYGNNTPALSASFSVVPNSVFTAQYSA